MASKKLNRKLNMGMVGGGPGAFIGDVHRKASRLDGHINLVAGAFDIDPKKSSAMGRELLIASNRTYADYKEMIKAEKALPEGERIDFVAVTTPNKWHYPVARDFLKAGFHVMCEKPMTMNLREARELKKLVKKTGLVFGLMHNYTGYPMVKLARDMVAKNKLGRIMKVVVRYPQGWLARPIEKDGNMQASWRTDPKQAGAGGCMGDIGTHAANLAEYITGLEITDICADLTAFIKGRALDDDGNCLLRFKGGAKGILHASQISIGEENNLGIYVFGEKGAVEWHQEKPNDLLVNPLDAPVEIWRRGNEYVNKLSPAAARCTRIPPGHPEGFFEAFANNYLNFADTVRKTITGKKATALETDFPGIADGVRGMAFIETAVKSSKSSRKWTKFAV